MAQKSILSFFKTADRTISNETEKSFKKPENKNDEESPKRTVKKPEKQNDEVSPKSKQVAHEDSPVKKGRSKRKVKCIESDDDSDDASNKVVNGNSEKYGRDTVEHEENSSKSSEKISVQINDKKKVNGKSAKKPPKMKKTENLESDKQPESPIKMEMDNSDNSTIETSKTNDMIEAVPSCSAQNDVVEFIPKRKTARKQMSSARNLKKNDVPIKVKIVEPKVEKKDTNSVETTSTDKTVPEQEWLSSGANEAPLEKSTDNDKTLTSNEDISESAKLEDNTENCNNEKDEHVKSPSSSRKSNSVNESDENLKKKVKVPVARKSTDGRLKANRKETKKNTPLKNSSKNDSIQSFFAPLKKSTDSEKNDDAVKSVELKDKDESMDDKNEADKCEKSEDKSESDEDNEKGKQIKGKKSKNAKNKKSKKEDIKSELVENEDSPVKVTRSRKKRKCLDSDEEDEAEPFTAPVKMAIDDSENKPDSSEQNRDTSTSCAKSSESKSHTPEKKECTSTSSEKSFESKPDTAERKEDASDNNKKSSKTPFKTDADISPKNDGKKNVLGVKSTSASGTVFDPSKNNYHPIEDACWKQNEKVPYLALAKTLELIENISGRLKIIEILSNFLRSVIVLSPNDLLQSVYLCLNCLAPEYEGIELGVGETLLMKAVAQATGRSLEKIKAEVAIKGDLGLVSESSRGNQRVMFAPPKLTVSSVFNKFLEIAKMSGNSVMAKKTDKIQNLFVACRDCEARYIIRSLSGKLRIGLAEQSVLAAIARAAVLTPPGQDYPPEVMDASKGMPEKKFKEFLDSQTLILKTAYCECPNYDLIIPVLLKEGLAALPKCCQLSPGRPLKPMLAHPTAGIDIVLERFDKNAFTCEFKYDGERAQIHMIENGDVTIFSRNQENNTSKYPDIISRIPKALKETTKSFILDSEAVAWDKKSKQILPFQVLSTRKRKDAVESEIVVHVCIMAFDLLYLNGESLVKKPLKERRSLLHSFFQEVENEFMFAQYKDGNSAETMQEFLDESVKGNCEGLMVKALEVDASYEIAKRSHNWLKLKKDYLQGIGDTLDLVVIGGYFGKGKRTGNYGGFLLACYDEENEEFQSICKLGTGFKDENLEAHTEFLKKHTIKEPKSYYRFDHSLEPDEWFEAVQVWEIKCADLSISPVHKAAIGTVDPEKGISLRFPRFIRIRDDKTPENATNSAQIADMYQKQQQIQNTSNKNAKNDEDYY